MSMRLTINDNGIDDVELEYFSVNSEEDEFKIISDSESPLRFQAGASPCDEVTDNKINVPALQNIGEQPPIQSYKSKFCNSYEEYRSKMNRADIVSRFSDGDQPSVKNSSRSMQQYTNLIEEINKECKEKCQRSSMDSIERVIGKYMKRNRQPNELDKITSYRQKYFKNRQTTDYEHNNCNYEIDMSYLDNLKLDTQILQQQNYSSNKEVEKRQDGYYMSQYHIEKGKVPFKEVAQNKEQKFIFHVEEKRQPEEVLLKKQENDRAINIRRTEDELARVELQRLHTLTCIARHQRELVTETQQLLISEQEQLRLRIENEKLKVEELRAHMDTNQLLLQKQPNKSQLQPPELQPQQQQQQLNQQQQQPKQQRQQQEQLDQHQERLQQEQQQPKEWQQQLEQQQERPQQEPQQQQQQQEHLHQQQQQAQQQLQQSDEQRPQPEEQRQQSEEQQKLQHWQLQWQPQKRQRQPQQEQQTLQWQQQWQSQLKKPQEQQKQQLQQQQHQPQQQQSQQKEEQPQHKQLQQKQQQQQQQRKSPKQWQQHWQPQKQPQKQRKEQPKLEPPQQKKELQREEDHVQQEENDNLQQEEDNHLQQEAEEQEQWKPQQQQQQQQWLPLQQHKWQSQQWRPQRQQQQQPQSISQQQQQQSNQSPSKDQEQLKKKQKKQKQEKLQPPIVLDNIPEKQVQRKPLNAPSQPVAASRLQWKKCSYRTLSPSTDYYSSSAEDCVVEEQQQSTPRNILDRQKNLISLTLSDSDNSNEFDDCPTLVASANIVSDVVNLNQSSNAPRSLKKIQCGCTASVHKMTKYLSPTDGRGLRTTSIGLNSKRFKKEEKRRKRNYMVEYYYVSTREGMPPEDSNLQAQRFPLNCKICGGIRPNRNKCKMIKNNSTINE